MTDQETKSSNTTADESHNTNDHAWTAPHRATALRERTGVAAPVWVSDADHHGLPDHILLGPGIGPEDEAIVERVNEEFAREQVGYARRVQLPAITDGGER